MDTREALQPPPTVKVLSVSYSVSRRRFIAGLSDGLRAFRTDNCLVTCEPQLPFDSGISIAEILDDRYIAFVSYHKVQGASPNVVIFWDAVLERELKRFDFYEPVLGVRLTSRWMAVILEERTILFQHQEIVNQVPTSVPPQMSASVESMDREEPATVRAPNSLHSIHPTATNTFALAALSNDLLLLPAKTIGQVQVISLQFGGSSTKRVLRAHKGALRCLALSEDASVLATASEQGTLIRVFDTIKLDQIAELRRGTDSAIINSLAFSPGNRWIASTSDKGTLHVFDLRAPDPAEVAAAARNREVKDRQHRKNPSYAGHRLSGTRFEQDSYSGMSGDRSSPAPSSALGAGAGYHGSVQEYYGLRPPPISASPPARDTAISAMAALKASPFAPRIFKDIRSIASAQFYTGDDTPHWQGGPETSWTTAPNGTRMRVKVPVSPLPNDPKGRPPKGMIAFAPAIKESSDDDGATIYVVGGGSDARWEMFQLLPALPAEGGLSSGWGLINKGFRKYLTKQFPES